MKKYKVVAYIKVETEDEVLFDTRRDAEISLSEDYNEDDNTYLKIEEIEVEE